MTGSGTAPATASESLRVANLALTGALILLVASWTCSAGVTATRAAFALLWTVPLWAPLPGMIRRDRRTYAWATLCVIPYFVLALTESIANPAGRLWSGTCLALAMLLFVALIAYLRVTRPR